MLAHPGVRRFRRLLLLEDPARSHESRAPIRLGSVNMFVRLPLLLALRSYEQAPSMVEGFRSLLHLCVIVHMGNKTGAHLSFPKVGTIGEAVQKNDRERTSWSLIVDHKIETICP